MLFCSYIFVLAFLPLTVLGYFLLNKFNTTAGRCYLLAASLFFYGYFNVSYLFLLLGSLLINYCIGAVLTHWRKRWLLLTGYLINLLILGYCKYYDFFVGNINDLFGTDWVLLNMMLPLGISFFTFQQISYLSDVYYQVLEEKYSPLTYSLFVTFFPQLVAGPIVLANEMMPQFAKKENHSVNYHNLSCGIFIFALGLAKKMLLADNTAPIADAVFYMSDPGVADSLIGSLAYCLQIYFDFSGYCDMAIGIGLMFNIVLPVNFLAPYRSGNIQEFWRTWHITLGRFLGQFVYRPLGGSRNGKVRTYLNLGITFLVSGLWHGANWMMILWGALHGVAIILHRIWSKELKFQMPKWLGVSVTFIFVWLAWIFFRAENMAQALKVFRGFGDFSAEKFAATRENLDTDSLIIMAVALGIIFFLPPANSFKDKFKPQLWHLVTALVLIVCSVFCFNRISPFIYFNF
ncbi:MAG: MBOAT family protein [Lentisphaerae bacterium]|nr:MBOAT family protein [Lentisphaerota bacterium]